MLISPCFTPATASALSLPDFDVVNKHVRGIRRLGNGKATAKREIDENIFGNAVFNRRGCGPNLTSVEIHADEVLFDAYPVGMEVRRKRTTLDRSLVMDADASTVAGTVPDVDSTGEPLGKLAVMFDNVDLGGIGIRSPNEPESRPEAEARGKFRAGLEIPISLLKPVVSGVHGSQEAGLPASSVPISCLYPEDAVPYLKRKIWTRISKGRVAEVSVPRCVSNPSGARSSGRDIEPIKLLIEDQRVAGKVDLAHVVGMTGRWAFHCKKCWCLEENGRDRKVKSIPAHIFSSAGKRLGGKLRAATGYCKTDGKLPMRVGRCWKSP